MCEKSAQQRQYLGAGLLTWLCAVGLRAQRRTALKCMLGLSPVCPTGMVPALIMGSMASSLSTTTPAL